MPRETPGDRSKHHPAVAMTWAQSEEESIARSWAFIDRIRQEAEAAERERLAAIFASLDACEDEEIEGVEWGLWSMMLSVSVNEKPDDSDHVLVDQHASFRLLAAWLRAGAKSPER